LELYEAVKALYVEVGWDGRGKREVVYNERDWRVCIEFLEVKESLVSGGGSGRESGEKMGEGEGERREGGKKRQVKVFEVKVGRLGILPETSIVSV
jgi:hypothetical protein